MNEFQKNSELHESGFVACRMRWQSNRARDGWNRIKPLDQILFDGGDDTVDWLTVMGTASNISRWVQKTMKDVSLSCEQIEHCSQSLSMMGWWVNGDTHQSQLLPVTKSHEPKEWRMIILFLIISTLEIIPSDSMPILRTTASSTSCWQLNSWWGSP